MKKNKDSKMVDNIEEFGYYNYIQILFTYGEKAGIVDPSMYNDISDDTLRTIASANKGNKITRKVLKEREKEEELNELDLYFLDNYIKKYLETSDTSFVKEAIEKGMGVFVELSNPNAKKYMEKKDEFTKRLNILSIDELEEIRKYYYDVKGNLENNSLRELKQKFAKRITIKIDSKGEVHYSLQADSIDENSIKNSIQEFLNTLEAVISKKRNALYYKGTEISLDSEEKIAEFLEKISMYDLCKFLLENYTHLDSYDNEKTRKLLISKVREKMRDEGDSNVDKVNSGDLTNEEYDEKMYQYNQINFVLEILENKIIKNRKPRRVWTRDEISACMRLIDDANDELWKNEQLRKKYYLPELDDLILDFISKEEEDNPRLTNNDTIYNNNIPFEIRLKMVDKLSVGYCFTELLKDTIIKTDSMGGVNNDQLRKTLESLINKLTDDYKTRFVNNCADWYTNGEKWIVNALYSQLLQQLVKSDSNDEFATITDENQRKYSMGIIRRILYITDFDKPKLPKEIIESLRNLNEGLKSISFGEFVNQKKHKEVTTYDIITAIKNVFPDKEVSYFDIERILEQIASAKGKKEIEFYIGK